MSGEFHDPELEEIEMRLRAERPAPRPAFRGALLRHLMEESERRPAVVRLIVAAYASSGGGLLAIAAAGLAGVGPFSP